MREVFGSRKHELLAAANAKLEEAARKMIGSGKVDELLGGAKTEDIVERIGLTREVLGKALESSKDEVLSHEAELLAGETDEGDIIERMRMETARDVEAIELIQKANKLMRAANEPEDKPIPHAELTAIKEAAGEAIGSVKDELLTVAKIEEINEVVQQAIGGGKLTPVTAEDIEYALDEIQFDEDEQRRLWEEQRQRAEEAWRRKTDPFYRDKEEIEANAQLLLIVSPISLLLTFILKLATKDDAVAGPLFEWCFRWLAVPVSGFGFLFGVVYFLYKFISNRKD